MPSEDENIKYLYLVLTSAGPPNIDWDKVAGELNLKKTAATKRWSRLKQAMVKGTNPGPSAQQLLWLCVKHSTHDKAMDWVDIAAKCNTTAGAASKRYSRMKQAFENGTATMPPVSSAKASGADGKAGVPAKRKRGAGGAENKAATEDSGDDADKEINKDVKKEVKPKPKPKPKRAPVSKKTKTVIKKEVDDGENQDLSDDMPLAEGQDGPDEQINEEPVDIEELKPKRGRVSKKANDNVDVKEKPKPKGAPVSKKTQVKKGSTHPSLTPTLLAELEATVREAHAKHYDSQFDEQLGEPSDGDEMDVNHERINGWLAEIHACDSGN